MGIDVARYGEDESAFVIAEMQNNGLLKIVSAEVTEKKNLMQTYDFIMGQDAFYKFRKIFIDDAGVGAGLTDLLIRKLGRKVVGLNNAKKSIGRKQTGLPAIPSARRTATDDDIKNKLLNYIYGAEI